jgi:alpha-D-ribose 1-methylphosphonate 5-triphosphate synthase subunit PhnI
VLLHIDGIDAMGFTVHYKMPHYVTFASDLDRLRKSQQQHAVALQDKIAAPENQELGTP